MYKLKKDAGSSSGSHRALGGTTGTIHSFIVSSDATEAKAESAREIHFPSKCQFVSVIVVYCKSVLYDGAMRQFGVSICICILCCT